MTSEPCLSEFVITSQPMRAPIWLIHGLALMACWLNGLSMAVQGLLSLSVLLSAHHHLLRRKQSTTVYLRYTPSMSWCLSTDGKEFAPILIAPSSVLTQLAIFFHYRPTSGAGKRRHALWLINHDIDPAQFRRLSVLLKLTHINKT